ncbi:MAG TPA: class I SAM-dependent methyltransferase [Geobacteraceae bacterium]|nr:class I SAM-dependent methyltransferase [Geobacteraceae bacterium]
MKQIARVLLRHYLRYSYKIDRKVVTTLGGRLFDGLHPKNVFNYRYEFFLNNVDSNDVVLDIGCGTGLILNKLAANIQGGVGIDVSSKNIALCQKLHRKDNLEFVHGDILQINYRELRKSRPYNTAVFSHVLEHLQEPQELIFRVRASKVLICVPSQENWYTQLLKHLNLPYFSDRTHCREYSREMLIQELRGVGYRIDDIGFNNEGEIVCKATTH